MIGNEFPEPDPDDLVVMVPMPTAEQVQEWERTHLQTFEFAIFNTPSGSFVDYKDRFVVPATTLDRWTHQWWAKYKSEPTPIYDKLVADVVERHDLEAAHAYYREDLPGYARYGMLSDRIRRGVVPPWTRLEAL